jgi:hypothetical protein
VKFIDPLRDQESLLEQKGFVVLDVLLTLEHFEIILLDLKPEHLSHEHDDLLELSVDHFYPPHGQLSVNLVRFRCT